MLIRLAEQYDLSIGCLGRLKKTILNNIFALSQFHVFVQVQQFMFAKQKTNFFL